MTNSRECRKGQAMRILCFSDGSEFKQVTMFEFGCRSSGAM
ncbi:MAG: hypothetical protein K0Q73_2414 [Paenibacillus sp.]|jgi:hypothetical protein|nr:hypothetical protein [Paenibacillus sp.]